MALFISTYARVGLLQKAGSRVANYGAFDHRKQSSRGCFSAQHKNIRYDDDGRIRIYFKIYV